MANSLEKQTIIDGSRNLVVKIHIEGDGSGDESETVLIDASSYSPASTDIKIMGIHSTLSGFTADLLWDATTNVAIMNLPDYEYNLNGPQIGHFGGLVNNAGAGKTGDILVTTSNLGAGDHGTIILEMKKRNTV
jgi:hypothetical protein